MLTYISTPVMCIHTYKHAYIHNIHTWFKAQGEKSPDSGCALIGAIPLVFSISIFASIKSVFVYS